MTTEMPENIWADRDRRWYAPKHGQPWAALGIKYTRTYLVAAKLAAADKMVAPEAEPVHVEILASAVYETTKGTSYRHILNALIGVAKLMPNGVKIVDEVK